MALEKKLVDIENLKKYSQLMKQYIDKSSIKVVSTEEEYENAKDSPIILRLDTKRFIIDGIEYQLVPADVDINDITNRLEELENRLSNITIE